MKKYSLLIFLFHFTSLFAQYTEADIYNYIEKYKDLAIRNMYDYKIPASIKMAQGIFESACGTSRLATVGNNHFGIKCHKEWVGDTIKVDDDELQECFRKYTKVEDSYEDHSRFLTSRPRYSKLFSLDIMDYTSWAKGLKEAGYATNPKYAERIISLIERFQLAQLDTIYQERLAKGWFEMQHPEVVIQDETEIVAMIQANDLSPIFVPNVEQYPQVNYPFSVRPTFENNKTMFVIAQKGDTYAKIAIDVQSDEKSLRFFNDAPPSKKLNPGEIVYIEKKGKKCNTLTHTLEGSESIHYVAQKYGIQISVIMEANQLTEKSVIKPGSVLKLRKEKRSFLNKWFK
ncbi:MAG TPA: glucosaminidase domain-containing protein [Bacteroidales bacterium]|nr:glucosaminidase domain-containing protein [Bacteroidales bacterium]